MTPSAIDFPPFPGFREEGLQFMRELKQNNRREWFKPRKSVYDDELVWPMQCLMAQLSAEAARRGLPLSADPEKAVFRIYRDVRFSKDKDPYKTHIGAVLTRTGDKKAPGGLYVHVEPGHSYVTGGFWRPDSRLLQAWRGRIEAMPDQFVALARGIESAGLALEADEKLKRLPRGANLDPEHPASEYLKWKSFLATRYVSDAELTRPELAETAIETLQGLFPLLDFGWQLTSRTTA